MSLFYESSGIDLVTSLQMFFFYVPSMFRSVFLPSLYNCIVLSSFVYLSQQCCESHSLAAEFGQTCGIPIELFLSFEIAFSVY